MSAASVRGPLCVSLLAFGLGLTLWPAPASAQDALSLAQIESQIAWLINYERGQKDLPQLAHDAKLSDVARKHSEEMRDRDYVGHISPVRAHRNPQDRYVQGMGDRPEQLGENVAMNEGIGLTRQAPQTIHTAFMGSPKHAANVVHGDVTIVGIGCATDDSGTIWSTELFAKPGKPVAEEASDEGAASPEAGATSGATAKAAPLGESGTVAAVTVWLKHADVTPGQALEVEVPVRTSEAIRWSVSGAATGLKTAVKTPSGATIASQPATAMHSAPTQRATSSGTYTFTITVDKAAPVRFLAIVGPDSSVRRYGSAMRTPTQLKPNRLVAASLGDGGGLELYRFTQQAKALGSLRIKALGPMPAAGCAVYGPAACLDWTLPAAKLPAGEYLVVVTSADARPGQGDFEIAVQSE